MIKAVIFDMDGLMVDTEPVQNLAFSWLIEREQKQPRLHSNGLVHEVGITERENISKLKQQYQLQGDLDQLISDRTRYYQQLLDTQIQPMPGLIALVKLLHRHHLPCAIASSSIKANILKIINKLNLKLFFSAIVSGTEVPHGKPEPDIFLEAAKRIHIPPTDCLVIGDAENDVIAAKKACMKIISVPNKYTQNQDFSLADKVVSSLTDIDWATISSL